MKKFNNFVNENNSEPLIKKGDKVEVTMTFFKGEPTYEVEAENDSWIHEGQEMFSFKQGGDMMMIAKFDGKKWVCK